MYEIEKRIVDNLQTWMGGGGRELGGCRGGGRSWLLIMGGGTVWFIFGSGGGPSPSSAISDKYCKEYKRSFH